VVIVHADLFDIFDLDFLDPDPNPGEPNGAQRGKQLQKLIF